MKTNHFNICPTCVHRNTCVLTAQKDQVWECSEYDRSYEELTKINKKISAALLKQEPAMA